MSLPTRPRLLSAVVAAVLAALVPAALRAEAAPPRLLRAPTLSATAIAFSWAGDLWTVPRTGGEARRLTASPGIETDPVFSPDGTTLAFTGNYDGNVDVYVIPATGGEPRRITWYPGRDSAVAWTRDGGEVVFRSGRDNPFDDRLFAVAAAGGWPRLLPLPEGFHGSYSPDGKRLAYMPHQRFQMAWKNYRGGEVTPIWILDLATLAVATVPRVNANDSYPAWAEDGRIYFLSDREGVRTLWRHDPTSGETTKVFANDGLDLDRVAAGPGAVVVERFGEIGLYDLASGAMSWPRITVAGDLESTRPRFAKVGDALGEPSLSPRGARVAFAARGEIVTVPAKKGDARNLTRSPGFADRDPAWSPDGREIAWLSDESGEYALHVAPADGLGTARRIPLGDPPSFFYAPRWSPDGKRIALYDKRLQLWIVEVASGARKLVDSAAFDHPARTLDPVWSPDSRFLAYTRRGATGIHVLFVHEIATGQNTPVTDGLADARYPAFDAGGKLLWFTASTDVGPGTPWLDMSSAEHPVSRALYAAVLDRREPSPFGPESDEEAATDAAAKPGGSPAKPEAAGADAKDAGKDAKKDGDEKPTPPEVRFDADGIRERIVTVPGVPVRNYRDLAAGRAGEVFVLEPPSVEPIDANAPPAGVLHAYAVVRRELAKLAEGVAEFRVAADGGKLLVHSAAGWTIADAPAMSAAGPAPSALDLGSGKLATDGVEVWIDPRAEWRQMYREAWRLQRDFFYDPHHHGLDLAAAEKRWAPWIDGIAHRSELNGLFTAMLAELSVGHLYVGGGDLPKAPQVKGGLLGADWEVANDRYRLVRVYGNEVWNPDVQAPLARPGVDARAGEYLIAVEGREVRPPAEVYAFFEGTAGKAVRIRLGNDPSGKGAREVTVVPVEDENDLRYRAWVEDNRRAVEKLSGGRLGYVHLPDTAAGGYRAFNRYFYAQVDREGMVVDERNNGGGFVPDLIVDVLARRSPRMWVATREGKDFPTPAGALFGPKAMIINRHAGSGGDALPWLFREMKIGPIVGTRTWGGLVGIWDYPQLVDGGRVTSPRGGLYGTRGKWEVENVGVAPDYALEVTPADFAAGRDPQLAKAVELLMAELAKGGAPKPQRPPYPNYQTSPWQSEATP